MATTRHQIMPKTIALPRWEFFQRQALVRRRIESVPARSSTTPKRFATIRRVRCLGPPKVLADATLEFSARIKFRDSESFVTTDHNAQLNRIGCACRHIVVFEVFHT